jgi:hypothetical protein
MQWSIAHDHYASRILQRQRFSLLLNHIVLAYLMRARHESKVDPPYFDEASSNDDGLNAQRASRQRGNSVRTWPSVSLSSWNFSLGMMRAKHTKNKRISVSVENRVTGCVCDKAEQIHLSCGRVAKAQWLQSGYNHCHVRRELLHHLAYFGIMTHPTVWERVPETRRQASSAHDISRSVISHDQSLDSV